MWGTLLSAGVGLVGAVMESNAKSTANSKNYAIQKEHLELNKQQLAMQKGQFDFQRERYEKWYGVYGGLQEDLGTYFKNLKGSDLSSGEKQQIQEHMQQAEAKLKEQMTSRGINGSGIEASLLAGMDYRGELAKAQSEATADKRATNMKMQFLGLGLNQGQAISNSMGNSLNSMGNTLNSMGNDTRGMQNINNAQAKADSDFWGDLSYGAGSLLRTMNPTGGSSI